MPWRTPCTVHDRSSAQCFLSARRGGRPAAAADPTVYRYDYLRRLTDAWTPRSGDCKAAKSVAELDGPAPYWLTWTFDGVGNRKTQVEHRSPTDTKRD
jgi:hypothetical protein